MEPLAERMKNLRKEKRLSQKETAKALDISFSAYCRYEYGGRERRACGREDVRLPGAGPAFLEKPGEKHQRAAALWTPRGQ